MNFRVQIKHNFLVSSFLFIHSFIKCHIVLSKNHQKAVAPLHLFLIKSSLKYNQDYLVDKGSNACYKNLFYTGSMSNTVPVARFVSRVKSLFLICYIKVVKLEWEHRLNFQNILLFMHSYIRTLLF